MSTITTTSPDIAPRTPRRTPRYIHIAAWAVPVLVIGQFAMLAIVPVVVIVVGTLVDRRVRALRWWAALDAAVYAAPLAVWLLRADGAQSLSKDIHPGFVALITAVSIVFLLKIYTGRRR